MNDMDQTTKRLLALSNEWSQREWGGRLWDQTTWTHHLKHASYVLEWVCAPLTYFKKIEEKQNTEREMSSDEEAQESSFLPLSTSTLNIAEGRFKNTLKWMSALHYYGASTEGIATRLFEEISHSKSSETAWRMTVRRSTGSIESQRILKSMLTNLMRVDRSTEAEAVTLLALQLLTSAPLSLFNDEKSKSLSDRQEGIRQLLALYHHLSTVHELTSTPPSLCDSYYDHLISATSAILKAQWTEAHANLNAIPSSVLEVSRDPLINALQTMIIKRQSSKPKVPLHQEQPASSPEWIEEELSPHISPTSESLLEDQQTPLPQVGEMVGQRDWRLEDLVSTLKTCRTWRARRRKGSLYKKASIKWMRLPSSKHNMLSERSVQMSDPPLKRDHLSDEHAASERGEFILRVDHIRPSEGLQSFKSSQIVSDFSVEAAEEFDRRGLRWHQRELKGFVPILEWGWDHIRKRLYIVEERLSGPSLYEAHQEHTLTLTQLLTIIYEILSSLVIIHEEDDFHGNIKPENIVWTESGRWVLTDPHLIPQLLAGGGREARERSQLFLSPEGQPSVQSDLYAVGQVISELLRSARLTNESQADLSFCKHLIQSLTSDEIKKRKSAKYWLLSWGKVPSSFVMRLSAQSKEYTLYHLDFFYVCQKFNLCSDVQESSEIDTDETQIDLIPFALIQNGQIKRGESWGHWFLDQNLTQEISSHFARAPQTIDHLLSKKIHTPSPFSHWSYCDPSNPSEPLLTFVMIPPGQSILGDQYSSSTPMLMSTTPVTRKAWMAMMNEPIGISQDPFAPIESVSWSDAARFCNMLSDSLSLPRSYQLNQPNQSYPQTNIQGGYQKTAKPGSYQADDNDLQDQLKHIVQIGEVELLGLNLGIRLPSLKEWTYAALGGQDGPYAGSNRPDLVTDSLESSQGQLNSVAQLAPNSWGLYNMSGLIWEWVHPITPLEDIHLGAPICGGSWIDHRFTCDVTHHKRRPTDHHSFDQGFRVMLSLDN